MVYLWPLIAIPHLDMCNWQLGQLLNVNLSWKPPVPVTIVEKTISTFINTWEWIFDESTIINTLFDTEK